MMGPAARGCLTLRFLSELFANSPLDYHKLFTYPCAVCNDVRVSSPSIRSDLSQFHRILYVVMPVTWHVGRCGNVLRCSSCATIQQSAPNQISFTAPTFLCELVAPVSLPYVSFLRVTYRRGQHVGGGSLHRSSVHCITGRRSWARRRGNGPGLSFALLKQLFSLRLCSAQTESWVEYSLLLLLLFFWVGGGGVVLLSIS